MARRLPCALALALLAVGCDGGAGTPDADLPGDAGVVTALSCTPDPARLDEARDCIRDDDCACGAYCEFQRCAHDCLADDDCADGEVCGATGRCQAPGADALKHRVSNASGLEADVERVELLAPDATAEISIRRRFGEADDLRVTATRGVEIACAPDAFGRECVLPAVGDEAVALRVRPTGDAVEPMAQIRVIPRLGIPLSIAAELSSEVFAGVEWGAIEGGGTYAGTATLIAAGHEGSGERDFALSPVPVTLTLHPGAVGFDQVLVIDDPTGAFSDDGRVVGRLSAPRDGFPGAMEIPAYLFAGAERPAAHEMQLVAQPSVEVHWLTPEAGRFDVRLSLAGVSTRDPVLRFRFDLERVAGPPGGAAPAVPPGVAPSQGAFNAHLVGPVEARFDHGSLIGADAVEAAVNAACRTEGSPGATLEDGATVSPTLPDLACTPGGRDGFTHPYVVRADRALDGESSLRSVLEQCAEDLVPLSRDGAPIGSGACVDLPRALTVMGLLADAERDGGAWEGEALFRRALQRWLELHTFLATDAVHAEALSNAILGRDERSMAADHFGAWRARLSPMLVQLLTPRLGDALTALGPLGVTSASYAAVGGSAPTEAGDRSIAITLLRSLAAEASLQSESLREQQRLAIAARRAPTVSEAERRSTRRLLALAAIASGWAAEAQRADPTWTSDPGVTGAFSRFQRSYEQLLGQIADVERGRDEFGLQDGEVPIYLHTGATDASDRAFAMTDYLAGSPSDGWLATEIGRAEAALTRARDAWLANQDASFRNQVSDVERARRVQDLVLRFDAPLQARCPHDLPDPAGFASHDAYADAVVAAWDAIDPRDCMIRRDVAECASLPAPSTPYHAAPTADEIEEHLCVVAQVMWALPCAARRGEDACFDRGPPAPPGFGYHESDGVLDASAAAALNDALRRAVLPPGGAADAHVGTREWHLSVTALEGSRFAIDVGGARFEHSAFELLSGRVERVAQGAVTMTRQEPDTEIDARRLARARQNCEFLTEGDPDRSLDGHPVADDPACYQGELGDALLGLRAARSRLEAARARFDEHLDAYSIATRRCALVDEERMRVQEAVHRFEDATESLRMWSQILGAAAEGFSSAAQQARGRSQRHLMEAAADDVDAEEQATKWRHRANALAVAGAGVKIAAFFVDAEIAEHRGHMEQEVEGIRREIQNRDCLLGADRERVGLDSAAAEARAALQEAARETLRLANAQTEIERLVREGRRAIQVERAFDVEPLRGAPWLSSEITSYRNTMRFARRLAYLAVLAAEYEQQLTLGALRGEVLTADSPDDLEEVRAQLAANLATRRIHGSAPATTVSVVSFRDQILAVESRTELPPSEPRLDPLTRFRALLTDPRFAHYEGDAYVGQLIPFELSSPERTLEWLGSSGFSESNCAERLWSVAAAVVGDEGFNPGGTQTEVHLLKRNRFSSGWCAAGADGEQVARFDPSRNLFLDAEVPRSIDVPTDLADPYTRLVLNNTATNASRADLERSSYDQGVQAGLAGRGLFGEYALFIPADTLRYDVCDVSGACASTGDGGLELTGVRDILLRFEYTAAAR